MTELPSDIEALKKLVQQLLEDVARLTAENIQLKAENADLKRRLCLNSGNSDKPPSSDGYQKKVSKLAARFVFRQAYRAGLHGVGSYVFC